MKYFKKFKSHILKLIFADDDLMSSEISIQKSLMITKVFYGLTFIIASLVTVNTLQKLGTNSDIAWLWLLSWLRLFSSSQFFYLYLLFILSTLVSCSLCFLFPKERMPKIVFAILFTLLLAFFYSMGKINHKLHAYMYISYFMPFLNFKADNLNNNKSNFLVLQASIAAALFSYFLAGVWKVRSLANSIFSGTSFTEIAQNLSYQMSLNIIEGTSSTPFIEWAMNWPFLVQFVLWLSVIYFELSCLLIPWRSSTYKIWALIFLLFHFGTALFFKIPFYQTQVIVVFLLLSVDHPESNMKNSLSQLPLLNSLKKIIGFKARSNNQHSS